MVGLSQETTKKQIRCNRLEEEQERRRSPRRNPRFSALILVIHDYLGFPGGSDGKESGDNVRDLGSTPGLGKSSAEGNGYHSSILAWRILWAEDPDGLQSTGSQRFRHD